MTRAHLTGLGNALPPAVEQARAWEEYFAPRYAGVAAARRLFFSVGAQSRHAVVNPCEEDVSGWSTGARMQRYLAESVPLGKDAVSAALADADLAPERVGLFAVASCTGYVSPGLDVRLAGDLGMGADVQRLMLGHMGCFAAIPGLGAVADFARSRGGPAVLLCLELTSLHVQPPSGEADQIVSHAIFGDAAAAAVVEPSAVAGWQVVDVAARTDPSSADHMTWDVTDLGFRMGLSPRVPAVLARHVGQVVDELLGRNGLCRDDVDGWAIHPGGPRIVDVVGRRLELTEEQLAPSRQVLAEHGNCSSATVLLVLERLRAAGAGAVVVMAFGPGLTLYVALLLT